MIKTLNSKQDSFKDDFLSLISVSEPDQAKISQTVKQIIEDVKLNGDFAVAEYSKKFDGKAFSGVKQIVLDDDMKQKIFSAGSKDQILAMENAHDRIRQYHTHQKMDPYSYTDSNGSHFSMRVLPLERVGIYVPGGKAAYPSSVMMNAVPASVAGVKEIVMVVPSTSGEINELVLAAAAISGVDKIFNVGGAQAIAALAFGTRTIPRVDKIVGPGNAYVAEAKRQVFGSVGIDMVAGPSEILIIADESANPEWVTMDLFSQAEHDELARAIMISPSGDLIDQVAKCIPKMLPKMSRLEIIRESLNRNGALVKVKDMDEACALANQIAPEHLELAVKDPSKLVSKIKNAGSIFAGQFSSEALGDYCAGPNHVLPTSGSARFSSGLSVFDFLKRTSVINVSKEGAAELGPIASTLARGETLTAHALAAELRFKKGET